MSNGNIDEVLVMRIIESLDVYVSDDDNYEMNEWWKTHGISDFDGDVSALYERLKTRNPNYVPSFEI